MQKGITLSGLGDAFRESDLVTIHTVLALGKYSYIETLDVRNKMEFRVGCVFIQDPLGRFTSLRDKGVIENGYNKHQTFLDRAEAEIYLDWAKRNSRNPKDW